MRSPPGIGAPHGRGHLVRVGDVDLYYEEYGEGQPLVLLHGFGGCARSWHPFVERLSESRRLIVVDLRGHGQSTNPVGRFRHREAADDVLLLLDHLGIRQCSALGMSSGGMALLHMATKRPDRIESMVLISATSHFPDQARTIMRGASLDRMPRHVQEMYRDCAKRGDAQIRELIDQFNALHRDSEDVSFGEQALSAITARTLIVHGDRDRFFPVEIAVDLYHAIPAASLWIIPGGDHVPVHDPGVPFVPTILRFLDGG